MSDLERLVEKIRLKRPEDQPRLAAELLELNKYAVARVIAKAVLDVINFATRVGGKV